VQQRLAASRGNAVSARLGGPSRSEVGRNRDTNFPRGRPPKPSVGSRIHLPDYLTPESLQNAIFGFVTSIFDFYSTLECEVQSDCWAPRSFPIGFSLLIFRPFSKSVIVKSINIIHNNKTNNKIIKQIRNTKDRKLRKYLTVIESSSHLCDKKKEIEQAYCAVNFSVYL